MIYTLDDKLKAVATDIHDATILANAAVLKEFTPSVQLLEIIPRNEYDKIIELLKARGCLKEMQPTLMVALPHGVDISTYKPVPYYDAVVNISSLRDYLGLPSTPDKSILIRLHPTQSLLLIRDLSVRLGRGSHEQSLQYWIAKLCLKKPGKAVLETDIMARYHTDFDVQGRGRAIRDATRKLNGKVEQVTGIKKLFDYSSGKVALDIEKLKSHPF